MESQTIACPFVYANGHRCCGEIYKARAYGPTRRSHYVDRDDVRKYRLWCSAKDDHAGAVSGGGSKERMEFYPKELSDSVENVLWAGSLLG
jgi:hypothetical protein